MDLDLPMKNSFRKCFGRERTVKECALRDLDFQNDQCRVDLNIVVVRSNNGQYVLCHVTRHACFSKGECEVHSGNNGGCSGKSEGFRS